MGRYGTLICSYERLCILEKLAGRLALLASRSTEVSKMSFEVANVVKNKFLQTTGAGRTYSKLLFWESQFSEIIYNSY